MEFVDTGDAHMKRSLGGLVASAALAGVQQMLSLLDAVVVGSKAATSDGDRAGVSETVDHFQVARLRRRRQSSIPHGAARLTSTLANE
jgi:hypothetical protein